MEEKFYTIYQIAEMLDMHHKTIRKFIADGKLGASKVGKQWRVSEQDLKVFMENTNDNTGNKLDEEYNIDFSSSELSCNSVRKKTRINVSTVIDINEINKGQYMRISNTLIAFMNSKDDEMINSTMHIKYYEKEENLKVLLWGQAKFIEEMLDTTSFLVESI